ncbi:hypothetical protein E4U13_007284 [Claviceps humidiphila]|uniref:Uncharacterized protein n=1 Tax=Claviceps humidiphila TaxID=1294629 RepID=A0A9P7U1X6_9HYPO|nr:hypothetical protein E4U13_007284 [Claviceps humidiphila]
MSAHERQAVAPCTKPDPDWVLRPLVGHHGIDSVKFVALHSSPSHLGFSFLGQYCEPAVTSAHHWPHLRYNAGQSAGFSDGPPRAFRCAPSSDTESKFT